MNALSMTGAFAAPHSIAAPGTSTTPATTGEDSPKTGGGDLLSAMNPAMDAAFAVGRPTNASGAAAILETTGAYVAGANATINKIDDDLDRRREQLQLLRQTDPDAADKAQQQIDLLEKLRDRIQLSIERVTRTASGGGEEDDTFDEDLKRAAAKRRERDAEQIELLERRRELLGAQGAASIAPTDASMVAGTYGAARAAAGTGSGGTAGAA